MVMFGYYYYYYYYYYYWVYIFGDRMVSLMIKKVVLKTVVCFIFAHLVLLKDICLSTATLQIFRQDIAFC